VLCVDVDDTGAWLVAHRDDMGGHHHTLLHDGFQARGNPNGTLTFYRPDGTPIGCTRPARRPTTAVGLTMAV
jgi:hypothetical protein